MTTKNQFLLENTIFQVLTQPTAPFRESWVKRALLSFCIENKISFFEDRFGNFWLGASKKQDLKRKSLVWVAHLDHPGIVIDKFSKSGSRFLAHGKWLGGGPLDIRDKKVLVFSHVDALSVLKGKIIHTTKGIRSVDKATIELEPSALAQACCNSNALQALGPWGACLSFSEAPQGVKKGYMPFTKRNPLWITKAADDLIGVCTLLSAFAKNKPQHSVALLSRAEESGFHGTLAVLEAEMLSPSKTQMISIETSSHLPGAAPGLGPVVRQGDKMGTFDSDMVEWIHQIAIKSKLPFQKRIMDGGTCEASAFKLYGFKVAGLSTPLLNYHNVGADQKALPEAVSTKDVVNLEALIEQIIRINEKKPRLQKFWGTFSNMKKKLLKNHKAHLKYFILPFLFSIFLLHTNSSQADVDSSKFNISSNSSPLKILFIGDSHSQGPIGNKLFELLRKIPNVELRFYSSCGSGPWGWLRGLKSNCGVSSKDQNRKPLLTLGTAFTPKIDQLLIFKPDLTIIEQGGNMMPVYRVDPSNLTKKQKELSADRKKPDLNFVEQETKKLLLLVQNHSGKCIWMGPPYSRRFVEDTFETRYGYIEKWAKEYGCGFIDNRPYAKYPEHGGDGLHYSDQMGNTVAEMTKAVAEHSFDEIKSWIGLDLK